MTLLDSIIRDLRTMPPEKLLEVARYVQAMHPEKIERRRAAWLAAAGSMAGKDGEEFERAVRTEGDRINVDHVW